MSKIAFTTVRATKSLAKELHFLDPPIEVGSWEVKVDFDTGTEYYGPYATKKEADAARISMKKGKWDKVLKELG